MHSVAILIWFCLHSFSTSTINVLLSAELNDFSVTMQMEYTVLSDTHFRTSVQTATSKYGLSPVLSVSSHKLSSSEDADKQLRTGKTSSIWGLSKMRSLGTLSWILSALTSTLKIECVIQFCHLGSL